MPAVWANSSQGPKDTFVNPKTYVSLKFNVEATHRISVFIFGGALENNIPPQNMGLEKSNGEFGHAMTVPDRGKST